MMARRRRTRGEVLLAVGAFLLLALLVIGVPLALATLVGWPLPSEPPSLDTLREPVTTTVLINVLAVLVWLAWAQFTACVLVEVKAAVSGVGMPAHVPGAGPSQALARQLVAAALLITAGAASFAPGLSTLGASVSPPPASVSVAAVGQHQQQPAVTSTPAPPVADPAPAAEPEVVRTATKFYRVHPPEGRHHDSLWEIAERHLGEGRRYHEIYGLNKDRPQPDGSRLTKASLIRPGWILEMPADAFGGDLVEVIHEATTATENPTSASSAAGSAELESAPQAESGPRVVAESAPQVEAAEGTATPFRLPADLVFAPLLAAGLLAALGRSRRRQLWHRAVGRRVQQPVGDSAVVEEALRIGAGPYDVRFLDTALRSLTASSPALPPVYAARLRKDGLDLMLARQAGGEDPPAPPAPWVSAEDGRSWHLSRRESSGFDAARSTLAPYPGLVSLGDDGPDRVLIDLEAAPGVIAVSGDESQRRAVLAAMAVELATNSWSDRMTVTLVGFDGDLTAIAPDRIRQVDTLEEILSELETEFADRHRALSAAGLDSVLTGRLSAAHGTRWSPHFVIVASEPSAAASERLAVVAAGAGRVGVGYLVAGATPAASWQLEVDASGRLTAPFLGIDVNAQRIPASQYEAVVELFDAATELTGASNTATDDDLPPGGPAPADVEPAVMVRVVGPLEVLGAGSLDPQRSAPCEEALVYLLAHRAGVHRHVLASALWPLGATADVSDAVIDRLGTWLGTDPTGAPNLRLDDSGRLRLGPYVQSDWDWFLSLRRWAGTQDAAESERLLAQALDLVRGPYLSSRGSRRYSWLVYEDAEAQVPAVIADTAVKLSEARLQRGDAEAAINAALTGMRGSPDDEELWRQLLRATHAGGDLARLESAVRELYRRTTAHALPGLHPLTEALVNELLPTWRTLLAS